MRFPVIAALAAGLLLAGCAGTEPDAADDITTEASPPAEETESGAPTADSAAAGSADEPGAEQPSGEEDVEGGAAATDVDLGEPAGAEEATRTIAVDAFDMAFDPERISVDAGEVVTFEVTNTGEAVHEFFLGDSAMQQEHAAGMAEMGHGMAHDEPYSIRLDPGETKELTWRFADGGGAEFACHEPGHYQAGMYGQITVG